MGRVIRIHHRLSYDISHRYRRHGSVTCVTFIRPRLPFFLYIDREDNTDLRPPHRLSTGDAFVKYLSLPVLIAVAVLSIQSVQATEWVPFDGDIPENVVRLSEDEDSPA